MIKSLRTLRANPAIFVLLLFSATLYGQDNLPAHDSLRQYTIGEVVITANRYENKILNTGSAVSSIDKK